MVNSLYTSVTIMYISLSLLAASKAVDDIKKKLINVNATQTNRHAY